MCKHGDVLSRPVLMLRGLDGYFRSLALRRRPTVRFSRPGGSRSLATFRWHSEGATPLPIPNRAVKPLSADGTWACRPWESRSPPFFHSSPSAPAGRARLVFEPRPMSVLAIVLVVLGSAIVVLVHRRASWPAGATTAAAPALRRATSRRPTAPSRRPGPPTAAGTASCSSRRRARRWARLARAGSSSRFEIVLVDDRPGVTEDRAHCVAMDGDERVRVVLARHEGGHWSAQVVG